MNDLDTLRPEVISALDALYNYRFNNEGFDAACKAICAELRRLAKENRILEIKNRGTLANNLCSDHRDKQAGRPCLVCLLEHAEAELLRLADDCARLVDCINAQPPTRRSLIDRAERAEAELAAALKANRDCVDHFEQMQAELAAMKARILPGAAKVEIADTDDPDGNPYGWVGGTLLSHNLIGKLVRLLVEE